MPEPAPCCHVQKKKEKKRCRRAIKHTRHFSNGRYLAFLSFFFEKIMKGKRWQVPGMVTVQPSRKARPRKKKAYDNNTRAQTSLSRLWNRCAIDTPRHPRTRVALSLSRLFHQTERNNEKSAGLKKKRARRSPREKALSARRKEKKGLETRSRTRAGSKKRLNGPLGGTDHSTVLVCHRRQPLVDVGHGATALLACAVP